MSRRKTKPSKYTYIIIFLLFYRPATFVVWNYGSFPASVGLNW